MSTSKENTAWAVTTTVGVLPLIAVVALGVFLIVGGMRALTHVPLHEFAAVTWQPLGQQYGMLPLLLGTIASTMLALMIAAPVGLCAALYVTQFASSRMRAAADTAIALLGALPSVVIGLWALTWIVPISGNSLASAVLVLAMMITPTFTLLVCGAMRQVPREVIETARSLGVGDNATALVVIRHARWGVIGAATLAACRGLGEAVAVSMVAGNVGAMPSRLTAPIATLTTTLIVEFDGATGVHRSSLYLAAAIVIVLIAAVSFAGRRFQRRQFA